MNANEFNIVAKTCYVKTKVSEPSLNIFNI